MPKIFEYLGIIIMFYSNEHEPIHVHGKYQGCESKAEFIIVDGKIIKVIIKDAKGKRPLPRKELKEFKNFVEAFKDDIVQKWIDYFVYHKSITSIKIEGKVK
ncbi:MAG: hypothetical protein DRG30_04965 [Epsilonproteobacteria bacterium]|nr:MAG: hypothetical protein DRG30_04965 [Campylobacterota bacterium]